MGMALTGAAELVVVETVVMGLAEEVSEVAELVAVVKVAEAAEEEALVVVALAAAERAVVALGVVATAAVMMAAVAQVAAAMVEVASAAEVMAVVGTEEVAQMAARELRSSARSHTARSRCLSAVLTTHHRWALPPSTARTLRCPCRPCCRSAAP